MRRRFNSERNLMNFLTVILRQLFKTGTLNPDAGAQRQMRILAVSLRAGLRRGVVTALCAQALEPFRGLG